MNFDFIDKELNNGLLEGIYLIYGYETYLIESLLKKIKKVFGEAIIGINYVMIDETQVGSIISEIQTPAFGYEKKLIIIKNSALFKKEVKKKTSSGNELQKKIADYITENIKGIKESTVVVFVEDEVEKNSLYSVLEKNAKICNCELLKPNELEARIARICAMYKVKIESDTLKYFVQNCGNTMQDLVNEIRKLIEYAGENGIITREIIDKLSIKKMESIIFDLTDNLGNKKIAEALSILDNLIYAKEPIQKILVTLYGHFKKLYLSKIAIQSNTDIIYALNLKPNQTFLVSKYKNQSRYFEAKILKKLLEELVDLDYNYKIGKIDIDVGLRSILCSYCS